MNTMFSALAMKSSSRERADLALVDRRAAACRGSSPGSSSPAAGLADPVGQRRLLAVVPLGPQQPGQEFLVGGLFLGGLGQFLVQDLGHPAQVQVLEQLLEVILHGLPPWVQAGRRRTAVQHEVVPGDVPEHHPVQPVQVEQAVFQGGRRPPRAGARAGSPGPCPAAAAACAASGPEAAP